MDTIMNKKMTTAMTHSQRTDVDKKVNNMLLNPAEAFNLNNAYLMLLAQNMDNWRLIRTYGINGKRDCPDYYNQLCVILDCMLDLMVDVNPEECQDFENKIWDYREQVNTIFTNGDGNTYMDKSKANQLQRNMSHTFRELLIKIDVQGMLRKKSLDPRIAMSDIE